jgi:serine/threonine protein kinase
MPGEATLPRLHGYAFQAEIGRGGAGVVYRAMREGDQRPVALKRLLPERATPRLLDVLKRLSKIDHPAVAAVRVPFERGGEWWVEMEHVEGWSLKEVLVRKGPLTPRLMATATLALAEGLLAAHAAGLVHGDVKPSNAMLSTSGEVKLLDFGEAASHAVHGFGTVLGTPAYCAPEVARGEPPGAASDLYSYGATLFEAFTGRTLFPDADAERVLRWHASADPPRLTSVTDRPVPPGFQELLDRLLRKEPTLRLNGPQLLRSLAGPARVRFA